MQTVSSDLDLTLVMDDDRTLRVPSTLLYSADHPFAVTTVFRTADGDVTWVFGRDLLDDGLIEPSGEGDVTVWPAVHGGRAVVCLALASPAGSALLHLDAGALRAFLDESYDLVPHGHRGRAPRHRRRARRLLGDRSPDAACAEARRARPTGRGRPVGTASTTGTPHRSSRPCPSLVADRALDHLHVAVAPLLQALVEVDHPLRHSGRRRRSGTPATSTSLHRLAGLARLGDVGVEDRRGHRVPARRQERRYDDHTDGRSSPPRTLVPHRRRRASARCTSTRVASAEHHLELAELRRLEARSPTPGADRNDDELQRRHGLQDVHLRHERLEDRAAPGRAGRAAA